MSQPKILTDILGSELKPAGFKRHADTWHLRTDDTVLVLNLQKSPYGRQYYINVAAWLTALGDVTFPKAHKCHIRCRWEDLIPNVNEKSLEQLLDLEDTSFCDEERRETIPRLLRTFVLPFFQQLSSLSGIKAIYKTDLWPRGCGVYAVAQDLLASESAAKEGEE